MSSNNWVGGAQAVQDIWTITPASVGIGNTFSITINNKTVTFTATANTVANVTAGLVALCQAANAPPEFTELTWVNNGPGTSIIGTSAAGIPVGPVTSSASGGSATNATVHTQTATGPNFWDNATNWSLDAVPVASDDVTIAGTADDILYNLDQHTVTLNSLTYDSPGSSGIKCGLPVRNALGYGEYRQPYLKIGVTTLRIINGSARVKIDGYTVQSAVTVQKTATSADSSLGIPAFLWKGTNASNTFSALSGTVGIGYFGGESATVATLIVDGATVTSGRSVTLTAVSVIGGGNLTQWTGCTTLSMYPGAGSVSLLGTGGFTTINCYGGSLSYQSSGTIATLNAGGSKTTITFEDNPVARTITNATFYSGLTVRDRGKSVTHTNPILVAGCDLTDLDLDYGAGRTYAIAG
jgi:hypothetical protein